MITMCFVGHVKRLLGIEPTAPRKNPTKGSMSDAGCPTRARRIDPPLSTDMDLRMDRPPQYCRFFFKGQPKNTKCGCQYGLKAICSCACILVSFLCRTKTKAGDDDTPPALEFFAQVVCFCYAAAPASLCFAGASDVFSVSRMFCCRINPFAPINCWCEDVRRLVVAS